MRHIGKYAGVTAVVYLDQRPKLFALTTTRRGTSLPGGGLENSDDSLKTAMYRELEEELELSPCDIELAEAGIDETFTYDAGKTGRENETVTRKVFLIKSKKAILNPKDSDVLDAQWLAYAEAMDQLTWPNARQSLATCARLLQANNQ